MKLLLQWGPHSPRVPALLEKVILDKNFPHHSVWEPACGEGHMAKVLKEYFGRLDASDIFPFGYGEVMDFLAPQAVRDTAWTITNPPFRLVERFALKALSAGKYRRGLAR